MLLNKNQWFNIVFQNINIPFDIKEIPKNMVKLELEIDNITPPDAIGDANLFYRNLNGYEAMGNQSQNLEHIG